VICVPGILGSFTIEYLLQFVHSSALCRLTFGVVIIGLQILTFVVLTFKAKTCDDSHCCLCHLFQGDGTPLKDIPNGKLDFSSVCTDFRLYFFECCFGLGFLRLYYFNTQLPMGADYL